MGLRVWMGSNFFSRAAVRAKKLLRTSSLRCASASVSLSSLYAIDLSQGAIANINRSTRASVRSSAFLHAHASPMTPRSPGMREPESAGEQGQDSCRIAKNGGARS